MRFRVPRPVLHRPKRPTLHVEQPESAFAEGSKRWTNRDLDPVPREGRTWGPWSFIGMFLFFTDQDLK